MSNLESYAHRFAKQTLVSWLREAAESACGDGWKACGIYCRPNRGGPYWGVYEEYPILDCQFCGIPVWDEDDWPTRYFKATGNWPDGTDVVNETDMEGNDLSSLIGWIGRPPTFDELIAMRETPKVILDVACIHKGNISVGFEIVHKNPVSVQKGAFLNKCEFPTLVLSASWILAQVKTPNRLVISDVYGPYDRFHVNDYEWSREVIGVYA